MKLAGLTGGVGMGKSAAARILLERGIPVIDTDTVARAVTQPGAPALQEIRNRFGDAVFDGAGALVRSKLAEVVFRDPLARQDLERILHPAIRRLWQAQVAQWKEESISLGFVVIPLLFETGAEKEFDRIICVACSAKTQQGRLAQRGWSPEQIALRIGAQWTVEKKMALSNYVIWSEGSLAVHAHQMDLVLRKLA